MTTSRAIPFGRPWITDEDRRAVLEVLEGHILTHGPQCKGFEADFAAFIGDDCHCISVSSCMAALHLAYFHMGIGPGDEVIVPAQTHTATVHAVELVGARPVFVDCESETGNVDCTKIERLITAKTKALSVVHFLGIPCDMDEIMSIADKHRLKVIEDCALALGARYKGRHVGLFGDTGCFSFYPVKHITTGEGGMFITRHKEVAESVRKERAFGVDRNHGERRIPGMYDVVMLGLNYRMSELQAALGRTQLAKIDENLERRRSNFKLLRSHISELDGVRVVDSTQDHASSSHYCLSVVLNGKIGGRRDEVIERLNQAGVGTSVYYPNPVPRMTYYRNRYGYESGSYPNAGLLSDSSIALPVGPHIEEEDIKYIANMLKEAIKEVES